MKQSGSSESPAGPEEHTTSTAGRHHGAADTGSGLIRSLIQLRPEAFDAHRARQAAKVADLLGLCRSLALRPGKRAGESRCQLMTITGCPVRRNPHEDTSAHEQIFGDPEHSWVARHARPLASWWRRVIGPDGLRWVSVEPLASGLAQLPGSQPGREVPDDHCRPIHRARHDPACLHRRRTASNRRA
jgi:hypothetical protein